jgi:hypothetical protein
VRLASVAEKLAVPVRDALELAAQLRRALLGRRQPLREELAVTVLCTRDAVPSAARSSEAAAPEAVRARLAWPPLLAAGPGERLAVAELLPES